VRTAKKLYFAYGSNINLDQMARRCPEATVVEPVTLENYELLFRGNGGGCGVATISPKEDSTVHGLLCRYLPGMKSLWIFTRDIRTSMTNSL
jgi:hypothetical protein